MSFAELLTQEQIQKIHEASLEILQETGFKVRFEPARELFAKHGCSVDGERVKFPCEVIEKYRKMTPPSFTTSRVRRSDARKARHGRRRNHRSRRRQCD